MRRAGQGGACFPQGYTHKHFAPGLASQPHLLDTNAPMAELIRLAASNEAEPQRLPRNVEAEAAFLGALLIDNRILEDVSVKLQTEHFFEPLHGRIFDQICRLIDRNMLVTPVTLKPLFEADKSMKELGGPGYLVKLTADGSGLIGARDFAQQIYDLALLRELVTVGRTLVENALDTSDAVDPKDANRTGRKRAV